MEEDDEAARKARAESLLQEIDRLTSTPSTAGKAESEAADTVDEKDSKKTESPREFIHRRMNELEHEDKP